MAVNFTRQTPTWADGHTVYAEDTERWEQLGADTATWTGRYDLAADLMPGKWGIPGEAFLPDGTNEATPADTLVGNPFLLRHPRTLDGMSCRVEVAAAAGATARLGLYQWNGTTWARVADPGTVTIDSTGQKTITGIGVALTAGVFMATVLASAAVTMRSLGGYTNPAGFRTNNANGAPFPDGWVNHRDYRFTTTFAGGLPATAALTGNADWSTSHNRVAVRLA